MICSGFGIIFKPISKAVAIPIMFIIVPNPGFCFNGIQSNKTTMLIKKVASPILKFDCLEIPSASTTHGELPKVERTKSDSPTPKIINPMNRKKYLSRSLELKPKSQVWDARHGVMGIVLCGFRCFCNHFKKLITVKL